MIGASAFATCGMAGGGGAGACGCELRTSSRVIIGTAGLDAAGCGDGAVIAIGVFPGTDPACGAVFGTTTGDSAARADGISGAALFIVSAADLGTAAGDSAVCAIALCRAALFTVCGASTFRALASDIAGRETGIPETEEALGLWNDDPPSAIRCSGIVSGFGNGDETGDAVRPAIESLGFCRDRCQKLSILRPAS